MSFSEFGAYLDTAAYELPSLFWIFASHAKADNSELYKVAEHRQGLDISCLGKAQGCGRKQNYCHTPYHGSHDQLH